MMSWDGEISEKKNHHGTTQIDHGFIVSWYLIVSLNMFGVLPSKSEVGATTETELKDKKLRLEDAINATKATPLMAFRIKKPVEESCSIFKAWK